MCENGRDPLALVVLICWCSQVSHQSRDRLDGLKAEMTDHKGWHNDTFDLVDVTAWQCSH